VSTIEAWTQIIRDIPKTSNMWGSYPPNHQSRRIRWPTHWKTQKMTRNFQEEEGDGDTTATIEDYDEIYASTPAFLDEDNEGLVSHEDKEETEDKVPDDSGTLEVMTSAAHDADVDFMMSISDKYVPDGMKQRFTEIVLQWQASHRKGIPQGSEQHESGVTETVDNSEMRRSVFVAGINTLITEYGHDTFFTVEELLDPVRVPWQDLVPDLQEPFTEDEIVEICTLLNQDQQNMK
jgi:hypothetical protein